MSGGSIHGKRTLKYNIYVIDGGSKHDKRTLKCNVYIRELSSTTVLTIFFFTITYYNNSVDPFQILEKK